VDEEFTLVTFKLSRKSIKRLSHSGRKPSKPKHKENSGVSKKGRSSGHGIHDLSPPKKDSRKNK